MDGDTMVKPNVLFHLVA